MLDQLTYSDVEMTEKDKWVLSNSYLADYELPVAYADLTQDAQMSESPSGLRPQLTFLLVNYDGACFKQNFPDPDWGFEEGQFGKPPVYRDDSVK